MPENIALKSVPGLQLRDGEPVFNEPWEAQSFAMTVTLNEAGYFTWPEWAETLGKCIEEHPDDTPYYEVWLAALQKIIRERNLLGEAEIARRDREWRAAEEGTPHGKPIELERFLESDNS